MFPETIKILGSHMILDIFRYERNGITKKKIISHVDNNDLTIISPVKG